MDLGFTSILSHYSWSPSYFRNYFDYTSIVGFDSFVNFVHSTIRLCYIIVAGTKSIRIVVWVS